MFPLFSILTNRIQIGRRCCLAAVLICLILPGCANLNLRGEAFPESETWSLGGQARGSDGTSESRAFSNKARQIDKNFPAR